MMSGMRKLPPISINSPRDTGMDRSSARVLSNEHHGGGVVVDHGGRFRAGEELQPVRDDALARAAPAGTKVVLERHWRGRGLYRRLHRLGAQDGAAQVGVDDRAREVEYAPVPVSDAGRDPVFYRRGVVRSSGGPLGNLACAGFPLDVAHGVLDDLQSPMRDDGREGRVRQHGIDTG